MSKNILIFGVILLVLIVLAYFTFNSFRSLTDSKTIDIKGNKIQLEIADSIEEQKKGLSGREKLANNKAMLFKFSKADRHAFWMKDMKFPIDIVFINGEKVVTIYENVKPVQNDRSSNLTTYTPSTPADKVLELNEGSVKKFGIKVNDIIKIN